MDNMDEIETKLINIINLMREVTLSIPRPENLITKTDKSYLMNIQADEEDFLLIRNSVSDIVRRNIANTKKCLLIYEKYGYLLQEAKKIDEWIHD